MRKGFKKFLTVLLSVAMICTYSVTAFAAEGGDGDGAVELTTAKDGKLMMALSEKAYLEDKGDGTYELTISMNSTAYDKVYPATAKEAVFAKETYGYEEASGVRTFKMPISESQLNKNFTMAAHSAKNKGWYDRIFYIDTENQKLIYSDAGHPLVEDNYSEIPYDNGVTSDYSMFKISSSRALINEDATVSITLHAGMSKRDIEKIALVSKDATDEEKEAHAINGTKIIGSDKNEYEYEFTISVEDIGAPLEFCTYQVKDGEAQWTSFTSQKYITVASTPSITDQMISAIYVQQRNEYTDTMCTVAKKCWDALSDEQKEAVEEGDYFGADTGNASADNPRNQDEIGENELLVVSFGTSFNDSRVATIGGIENALEEAYPEYSVRRAFTAQIIINHIQSRDEEVIDNMDQALERAVANGVKELVVQPTHLMHGHEYDEMCEALKAYESKFDSITISEPLLDTEEDRVSVAIATIEAAAKDAGFENVDAAKASDKAFVFMGHGTSHKAKESYVQMQKIYSELGFKNVFIGTVEGNPESTSLPEVKKAVEAAGYSKVVLRPLMVVAGDHANNDMAGDEEGSWYYGFAYGGEFEVEGTDEPVDIGEGVGAEAVDNQIAGLGEIEEIQKIYVAHVCEALDRQSFGEKTVTKEVGCTEAGIEEYTCETCGWTKKRLIPATGHAWDEGKITTKATCEADGVKTYTCANCNGEKTEVIPATGHTWDAGKVTKAATCIEKGVKTFTCTVCKKTKTSEIKATGKHNYTKVLKAAKAATCTAAGNTEKKQCSTCEKTTGGKAIPAKGHDYNTTTKAATPTADGYTQEKCSRSGCTAKKAKVTIAKIEKITLEKKKYTYNGKYKKPAVTVKDSKGNIIKSTNYTVSYSKNKAVGLATATVKFNGKKYAGTMKANFKINPKGTKITSLTKLSKGFKVKWAKQAVQTTGYEIRYSTKKSMKNAKTVKVGKASTVSKKITGLKAKKTYYVQIRTYKTVNSKPYRSAWSAKSTVKTK